MKWSVFILLSAAILRPQAADVRFFGFSKGEHYLQENVAAPALAPGLPFQFRAFVLLNITNPITATIKWPNNGLTKPLTNYFKFAERTESSQSRASINFAAPNGVYTMSLQTASDGQKIISLNLSADFYPSIPRIANFPEAQRIDPAANFILRWDNPVTTDFLHLKLFEGSDLIFQTPDAPQTLSALTGASNAVVLPKNLLAHGKVYRGELTAWKKISADTTTYPGAVGYAAYTRQTDFTLRTIWNVTNVYWFGLSKTTRYQQTSIQPPTLAAGHPYEFHAFVEAVDGKVLGGQIQTPPKAVKTLAKNSETRWQFTDRFASNPMRDSAYPNGAYELGLQTMNNGAPKIALNLAQAQSPVPHINSWNEVNAIDPTKPFLLSWAPLGGTTNDFLQVIISKQGQAVFQTPAHPWAAGALNGTTRNVSIPTGLLQPGETCDCTITFLKAVALDTFNYPGALGYAAVGTETSATLRAQGGTPTPPTFSGPVWNNGQIQFTIDAIAGRQYTIQTSSDLRAWRDLLTTNAPASSFQLQIVPNPTQPIALFRALAQ